MPTLQWLNRNDAVHASHNISYHLLERDEALSFGAISENMIIQGDNLVALKSLLPYYKGQVKCIYIDPPYNTGSAFEHYDDNVEHSQWLSLMYPRLELLCEFLSEDGSIWISIDDNEAHYLKVMLDEIFGRKNFAANVVWQKRTSPDMRATLGAGHDHILVYTKNYDKFRNVIKKIPKSEKQKSTYKNPDNDPRGPWSSSDFTAQGYRPNQMYSITTPGGKVYEPPVGRCWKNIESVFLRQTAEGRMWFGKDEKGVPRRKTYLYESEGQTAWTWWENSEVGHNQEAKKEIIALFGAADVFDTPKPERLIRRIIHLSTNPGDIVLDSFLGSGTTAAVAHKMGRRYIGIEMGAHAITHVVPRLKQVVDGEQGGISKAVAWNGGGGFSFYHLGETVFDEMGHINSNISFSSLAAHIWFADTGKPFNGVANSPMIGINEGVAYYLLYGDILGENKPTTGNILTNKILNQLPQHNGPKIIYGEASRIGEMMLKQLDITFKQIPYDIRF